MGYRNREIEKKFIVAEKSYAATVEYLEERFAFDRRIIDASKDYYWHPHSDMKVTFARLRYMPDGKGQMTIKYSDRDSNLNRIEIDVEVEHPEQAKKFLTQLLGEPCGSIFKKYHVLFIGDEHTTVSIYSIRGDNSRVFVEVEAKSQAKLEAMEKLIGPDLSLTHEPKSLYQLFFTKA